ncbi:hypothetical protein [Arenimonas caeni]|uniref:DUF4124 domain-containing protein n=1 Tax=Arenimonas caeni TaxID=2058085 RepID=A0A2P6MA73_9GAMM|nr:hypothetical protein [Arenimonas caeni]PRH82891.1 hypothetical protein C6N40_04385 [Arenimonas caeni]
MSRTLLLVAALTLAGATGPGPHLRKCVSPAGAVSYQDQPCAPGADEAWVQPVKALPPPAPVAAAAPAPAVAGPVRAGSRAQAPPARPDPRRARCDRARREADELRDRQWNRLGFKERSELDARVARACARDG